MKEDPRERASKYLETTIGALNHLKTRNLPATISENQLNRVLELVQEYTQDTQHYLDHEKPVTSLACVAYAEGLLDALKFLDLIET